MKKVYLSLAFLFAGFAAQAQSYHLVEALDVGFNPGHNLNTDPEQPLGFLQGNSLGWVGILGTSATDTWSAPESIPFNFNFAGSAVSSYRVSASGVLTFDASTAPTAPGTSPEALPSSSIPDKSVCAWGLSLTGSNDDVVSKTFGTAPNRQHWVMWTSVTNPADGGNNWAYWGIMLEESTDNIYVVDMRNYSANSVPLNLTVGIQEDASTAIQVSGSPSVNPTNSATGGNQSDELDNSFYMFGAGTQPQYDLQLVSVETPEVTGTNSTINFDAMIFNQGSAAITSFDYEYDNNSGNSATSSFSGNIASGGVATYSHSPGWTTSTTGSFNVDISVLQPNGNSDANPSDNSFSRTIQVANDVPRTFLAEEFGSSTCPPCKTWNDNVYNAALANYNTVGNPVVIKNQVPIPVAGDPSHNGDADARRAYYSINSAPSMVGNGTLIDYGNVGSWGDASAHYQQVEQDGSQEPAFVKLTGDAKYDGTVGNNQAKVTVNANVESKIDLSNGNYALQMVVMQRNYTYNQASNGDFEYKHVMRKMLPSPQGTSISLSANGQTSVTEDHTFDIGNVQGGGASGNYNLWNNDVEVALLVEDRDNLKVMNATMLGIEWIGVDENQLVKARVFPNPASESLHIDLEEPQDLAIELVDMSGKTILKKDFGRTQNESISLEQYAEGMYILKLVTDGKMASQRISVKH